MRIVLFLFFLVFLQPAYALTDAEECREIADRLELVAKLRDGGTNPFYQIQLMVRHWDEMEDPDKKLVLAAIVFVWGHYPDKSSKEIHTIALDICFAQKGIKQA
jgi:hypothetical protein